MRVKGYEEGVLAIRRKTLGLHIHTQEDAFGYEYEDVVLAYIGAIPTVGTMRGAAIWPSCFERLVPQLAPVLEPTPLVIHGLSQIPPVRATRREVEGIPVRESSLVLT